MSCNCKFHVVVPIQLLDTSSPSEQFTNSKGVRYDTFTVGGRRFGEFLLSKSHNCSCQDAWRNACRDIHPVVEHDTKIIFNTFI